jgi:hypothetical protein
MLSEYAVRVLVGGVAATVVLLFVASTLHHRYHFTKKMFFTVLCGIIISTTVALVVINLRLIQLADNGSISRRTGYLNIVACSQTLGIVPQNGILAQSAGDATHQIYPNGELSYLGYRTNERADGTLGGFFQALGGTIASNVIALPLTPEMQEQIVTNQDLTKFVQTNPLGEKYLELKSGDSCDTSPSMLSIFLYEYSPSTHSFVQKRVLRNPEEYMLSDNDFGQPDCVVIVFGEPSERTDITCRGYPNIADVTYAEAIE